MLVAVGRRWFSLSLATRSSISASTSSGSLNPSALKHELAGHRVHVRRAADSVGPEELARRLKWFLCQADGHVGGSRIETQILMLRRQGGKRRPTVRHRTFEWSRRLPAPPASPRR